MNVSVFTASEGIEDAVEEFREIESNCSANELPNLTSDVISNQGDIHIMSLKIRSLEADIEVINDHLGL